MGPGNLGFIPRGIALRLGDFRSGRDMMPRRTAPSIAFRVKGQKNRIECFHEEVHLVDGPYCTPLALLNTLCHVLLRICGTVRPAAGSRPILRHGWSDAEPAGGSDWPLPPSHGNRPDGRKTKSRFEARILLASCLLDTRPMFSSWTVERSGLTGFDELAARLPSLRWPVPSVRNRTARRNWFTSPLNSSRGGGGRFLLALGLRRLYLRSRVPGRVAGLGTLVLGSRHGNLACTVAFYPNAPISFLQWCRGLPRSLTGQPRPPCSIS